MTNSAPGQPPAPHPSQSWPDSATQRTQVRPQAQHPGTQETQDESTRRIPRGQPGPTPPPAFRPQPTGPTSYQPGGWQAPSGPQGLQGPQGPPTVVQQPWSQGFAPPPAGPGQFGAYGPPQPPQQNRKTGKIVAWVAVAVAAAAVLVIGIVMTVSQVRESVPTLPPLAAPPGSGVDPFPLPDSATTPDSGLGSQGGDSVPVQQLEATLRSALNERDVEGLLESVCEDGKVDNAARNDLLAMPFLAPGGSQEVEFLPGSVTPDGSDAYVIAYFGADTTTFEPVNVSFTVYTDDSGAFWCGIE